MTTIEQQLAALNAPMNDGVEELLVSGLEEPIPAIFTGGLTNDVGMLSSEESF